MVRRVLSVAAVLVLLVGVALATDEGTKATVKNVDAENNKITLTVGDDEKTYDVSKDAEIYTQGKGKKNKPAPKDALSGGLKSVKANTEVTFVTIKSGGKEVIVSMKIEGMARKK
jgi:Cu/Ag efflux protein CusF